MVSGKEGAFPETKTKRPDRLNVTLSNWNRSGRCDWILIARLQKSCVVLSARDAPNRPGESVEESVMAMLGVWVNVVAVLVGGIAGMTMGKGLPDKIKTSILMAIGLGTLAIGVDLASKTANLMIPIASLVLGTALGGALNIEARFEAFAQRLKDGLGADSVTFVEGFVTASLLFCIGPMSIIGSINGGAFEDHSVLYLKSLLDGFAALALASTLGVGVLVAAVVVLTKLSVY